MPCSQPHVAEVYHVFTLTDGPYPGQTAVEKEGDEKCGAVFQQTEAAKDEDLGVSFLYPRPNDWPRDQGVTCLAVDMDGTRTTSIKD